MVREGSPPPAAAQSRIGRSWRSPSLLPYDAGTMRPTLLLPALLLLLLLLLLLSPSAALRAEDEPPEPNYVYRAELVRIVDGDRVAFDIDLGFSVWTHNQTLALLDAGGSDQDETERARDPERLQKLRELLGSASEFVVRTVRDREANPPRYLATVWADGVNVNEAMKEASP